jgi:HPt (histidine-containing phosphotransfer) domain-containing protein
MHGDETTRAGAHLDIDVRALDADAVRALYELLGEDREALAEIVDAFLDEAPRRLAELRHGVDQNDSALAGRAAHTLKSNGDTFGAVELVSLCRRLEVAARANDLAGSADLLDAVDAQWTLVSKELTELRNRGRP